MDDVILEIKYLVFVGIIYIILLNNIYNPDQGEMRVAVVIYGQPRDYNRGYHNLQRFFSHHQNSTITVDYFYHGWTIDPEDTYKTSPWRHQHACFLQYNENIPEILENMYHPIVHKCENQSKMDIDENIYKNTIAFNNTGEMKQNTVKNVMFQFYSRNQVRNILEKYIQDTNTEYDFVIMTRFDIGCLPPLDMKTLDRNKIHISNTHTPGRTIPDNFIVLPVSIFLEWFDFGLGIDVNQEKITSERLSQLFNNAALFEKMKSWNERFEVSPEDSIFMKYLSHHDTIDKIEYFSANDCLS